MIDIKAIRDLEKICDDPWHMSLLRNTVLAMCDEIERLRADASRYQWLRGNPFSFGHGSLQVFMDDRCGSGNYNKQVWDEELDAAIDAAMGVK